ncbi:MAG: alpha/beta hydrolase [Oscillospiraceae bacterium]|jgi:pimeloyl-ACP methyl ester carboxylesterase|nr:alpha/beta hydrolase [Oscillospiraceae bacterium]
MEKLSLFIKGIPAVLWGPLSQSLFIAVHGDQSDKEDAVIAILAEEAVKKGYQVLSFDLPEHGARKAEPRLCKAQTCVEDLSVIMAHAQTLSDSISLFGCSIGAYFGMLACGTQPVRHALFLSPVVDMKRIIDNMMGWFDVSVRRLETERAVVTPAKTLYWDYYQYVLSHPVRWDKPTAILYGSKDSLCERNYVDAFAVQTGAELTVMPDGEHFFHTEEQLMFYRRWLEGHIKPAGH